MNLQMHIGGAWVESESGARTEAISPATGETIGSVPEGTPPLDMQGLPMQIWS